MNRLLPAIVIPLVVVTLGGCAEASPDEAAPGQAGRDLPVDNEAADRVGAEASVGAEGSAEAGASSAGGVSSAAGPSSGQAQLPDSLRAELIRLGEADQAARGGLSPERMQDKAFMGAMLRGDSARSHRLRAIVDAWGWPDSTTAGPARRGGRVGRWGQGGKGTGGVRDGVGAPARGRHS